MGPASKYTFDVEFRGDADIASNAARARQKKSMTTDEIDAMCARARAEGIKAGLVRTSETLNQNIAALAICLRAALDQSVAQIESLRAETAALALGIAARLAPAAIAALPAADVEAALRQMLRLAVAEPRVILSAAPAVLAAIEPNIAAIAAEEGYDGRVILSPDAALSGADCRIEWRGGGGERSEQAIRQAIEALIAQRFSTPAADSPSGKG